MAKSKEIGIFGATKLSINTAAFALAGAATAVSKSTEAAMFAAEMLSLSQCKALLEEYGWSEDDIAHSDLQAVKNAVVSNMLAQGYSRPEQVSIQNLRGALKPVEPTTEPEQTN